MKTIETIKTIEELKKELLNYFKNNEDIFNDCIEELDNWNGYLNDDRYYYMSDIDEFYYGEKPSEIVNRFYYGHDESGSNSEFNPNKEYFYFNGYGNPVSADYKDYSGHLDNYFIDDFIDNFSHLFINDDYITEIIELIEENENDENN